ncbi:acyl-CoA thioesterase [Simkania negevensis]
MQCPVVSQSVKYLKPLFSLQEIEVHVWIESYSKVRFVLGYEILRGKDKILIGQSEHCFLDQNFKPLRIYSNNFKNCLSINPETQNVLRAILLKIKEEMWFV